MPAVLVICGLFTAGAVQADERLKGIACRSVHLSYPQGGQVDAFYNEVKVEKSAPGTYFMVCGWQAGYFGIQELANGKKLLIFSVWDRHGGDDPKAVPDDLRVKLIDHDPQVRIGRFGNEGTGGQSFFDYDWKIGETYRFMVSAKVDGNRTQYTGWFYVPESKSWKRLVTFSTITDGHHLSGLYSFVEDFKRDRHSATLVRKAEYGNVWTLGLDGQWQQGRKARFTGDANPVENIDGGHAADRFFLATGGETVNQHLKLREIAELPAEVQFSQPTDLPQL